jgi:iron complex outermembrane recepter protein
MQQIALTKGSRRNWLLYAAVAAVLYKPAVGAAQEAAVAEAEELQTVVITGSRIQQSEFDASTPTASLSAETIELSGSINLTDFLTSQPSLAGSLDSSQTSGSNGFIGSTGLNLLNLRNLGTNRTLVLLDGRRHVAQQPETAAVDINTIPLDLIKSVDVVTGGVSAVYGADAVSGVVNIILKRDFEGLTGRVQYGEADENGKPVNWLASSAASTFWTAGPMCPALSSIAAKAV